MPTNDFPRLAAPNYSGRPAAAYLRRLSVQRALEGARHSLMPVLIVSLEEKGDVGDE